MPLWSWVADTSRELRKAGHVELADAVVHLPKLAAQGDAARVTATAESALLSAGRLAHPAPVQVRSLRAFLGHWPVAVRVGAFAEGLTSLEPAETRARAELAGESGRAGRAGRVPVSAAESLASCYANIDAPGYAAEREAILTPDRIADHAGTPAWTALAVARANLLIDDGRPDGAVHELRRRAEEARAFGMDLGLEARFALVRALRHQDRHARALELLADLEQEAGHVPPGAPRAAVQRRIRFERARLLAWLVRTGDRPAAEAVEALPSAEEAEAHPRSRPAWAEAVENLVHEGAVRNDWRLGVRVTAWSRYFERVGAPRRCAELALSAARLAVARGARWVAACSVQRAERALPRLRRTEDLAGDVAEARSFCAALPAPVLPVPAEEVLPFLRAEPPERVDPERQVELVTAALGERPEDTALLGALSQVGRTLVLTDAASAPQWRHIRRTPGDRRVALRLLESLIHDNDTAGVRALARTLTEGALARAHAGAPAGTVSPRP